MISHYFNVLKVILIVYFRKRKSNSHTNLSKKTLEIFFDFDQRKAKEEKEIGECQMLFEVSSDRSNNVLMGLRKISGSFGFTKVKAQQPHTEGVSIAVYSTSPWIDF